MPDQEARHLTEGQIMALAPDGSDDAAALHLESCAECRSRVLQWREACALLAPASSGEIRQPDNCPSMEHLANYAAGEADADDMALLAHVAECRHCAATLKAGIDDSGPASAIPMLPSSSSPWRRRMAGNFRSASRSRRPAYWKYAVAAGVVLTIGASLTAWWAYMRSNPSVLLAKAYTETRPFDFRLEDSGYARMHQQRGSGSAFDRPEALEAAIGAIRRKVAEQPNSPDALALKGRAELLEHEYESAIESLTRASQADEHNADVLIDLAVALAVRGEAETRPSDYGQAADILLRALRRRSNDGRALFNLGLTYERLSQVDLAIDTWKRFLKTNPEPGWRQEAESHLAAMQRIKQSKAKADGQIIRDPVLFQARYGAGAPFDPLPWYDIFWTEWLPQSASDQAAERAARIVAEGFTRYGEFSLIESLTAPPSAAKNDGLSLLATAMKSNRSGHPGGALEPARKAAEQFDSIGMRGAAALARDEFIYAASWSDLYAECQRSTELTLRTLGTRYPWLEGNARLNHATCLQRMGQNGAAREEIERALAQTTRAGLWPIALRAQQFMAGAQSYTGNFIDVWQTASEGIERYWNTPATAYRGESFEAAMQEACDGLGWKECAIVFCRATIDFARQAGNVEMEASNRSSLARMLREMQDYRGEILELDQVQRLLDHAGATKDVAVLKWEASLRRIEARIATGAQTNQLPELDKLAAESGGRETGQQVDLQQTRGLAYQRAGDFERAAAAFGDAIRLNRTLVEAAPTWVRRMPILEQAAVSFRNLTQIDLMQKHDPVAALAKWQQFRPSTPSERSITMADLPAGVGIWTADAGVVTFRWAAEPPEKLRRTTEQLLLLCTTPNSDVSEIRQLGRYLYRGLLQAALERLSPGVISISTDSWLATIPFGALTDDREEYLSRRYFFVEGYGPRTAESAEALDFNAEAVVVTAAAVAAPGGRVLPILAAAEREADQVAGRFKHASIERRATVEWLSAHSERATVFHFSGHGWANGGSGALILPPGPNGEPRFVTSANLANQNWSHCGLAVLSACLTAAGERRGAVNNQSLVQALFSAGAARVVAARWSIDSESTRALMEGFYARLISGKAVPEALSEAAVQVAANPGWSHPYYWAGFDVFGAA